MHSFYYKNKWITAGFIIGFSLLSSCSLTPPKSMMNVQAGETFVLKQAITFPAEKTRQFIQFGEVTGSGFNHSEQHCRIELYEMSKQAVTIQPESFIISRVQLGEEQIARTDRSMQFAANQYAAIQTDIAKDPIMLAMDNYDRPETMDLVHLYLKSDKQPNVYRLTCAGALSNGDLKDAPRSYRPERADINRILGNIGMIR